MYLLYLVSRFFKEWKLRNFFFKQTQQGNLGRGEKMYFQNSTEVTGCQCGKMNFDPYFTWQTKIKSRWIINLNIKIIKNI